jgi:hypothetical protein
LERAPRGSLGRDNQNVPADRASQPGENPGDPIVIDVASLFEITASMALVVGPAVVLNRLLAEADGPTLADLFAIPVDPSWPRGVQEEEPVRWRPDLLDRRRSSPSRWSTVADRVASPTRPRLAASGWVTQALRPRQS